MNDTSDYMLTRLHDTYGLEIVGAWEKGNPLLLGGKSIREVHGVQKDIKSLSLQLYGWVVKAFVMTCLVVTATALKGLEYIDALFAPTLLLSAFLFLTYCAIKVAIIVREIERKKPSAGTDRIEHILRKAFDDMLIVGSIRSTNEAQEVLIRLALMIISYEESYKQASAAGSGFSQIHVDAISYLIKKFRIDFQNMFETLSRDFSGLVVSTKGEIYQIADARFRHGK